MDAQMELVGSSLGSLAEDLRACAHNLANTNTAGYKRLQRSFASTLASASGTASGSTSVDFRQGALAHTGRPLDLALQGEGFFVIQTPGGELYTRNGSFRLDAEGQLVDASGRIVAGEDGPVVAPRNTSPLEIRISGDGRVTAGGRRIATLRVVRFPDASVLRPVGMNCFKPPGEVRPTDAEGAVVHQGYRESSNVSTVEELVRLITITRLYQANVKSITSRDDRLKNLLAVAMGT